MNTLKTVRRRQPLTLLRQSVKASDPFIRKLSDNSKATNQPKKETNAQSSDSDKSIEGTATAAASKQKSTKTVAQADEELRMKMSGLSGDGGDAGIEYEDGQPVSMKRGVRENMFRYI